MKLDITPIALVISISAIYFGTVIAHISWSIGFPNLFSKVIAIDVGFGLVLFGAIGLNKSIRKLVSIHGRV